MKILVANLGSTSFKYRLFEMAGEAQLARGGIDRIGQDALSTCFVEIGARREEEQKRIPDHAAAMQMCLDQLTQPQTGCLAGVEEVAAIGFKAVCAGRLSGVRRVDDELLAALERLADVAPAHNPPYARAMRQLRAAFPAMPLVAALETGFHETIPDEHRVYGVPYEWREQYDVQRWGYHGASHRYIAGRMADIIARSASKAADGHDGLRLISCHLGGSNSLCAIRDGKSVANSLGMSPQTGLLHNNRTGDFDPYALPILMRATGKGLEELLDDLANRSGLLGLSGLSGDLRDLENAAAAGNARAALAVKTFVAGIRHYLGAYLVVLGGADAIVFTGGIGENSRLVREQTCAGLEWAGIRLDPERNAQAKGEARVSTDDSPVQVWTVPTNEELVVARQTAELVSRETRDKGPGPDT
ncbi:MAG: acetate/propionate family kinase [Planctomycetes bacterium]|nr:acetate/propionate family kinase [Planctomycetota bacterium]